MILLLYRSHNNVGLLIWLIQFSFLYMLPKQYNVSLANYLGLPMPPPYLNLSDSERGQITTGINYASGSCGILNTTRQVRK